MFFLLFGVTEGMGPKCTFTKKDVPVPDNALIVGDPRKNEKCRATSFDSTKPSDFFDPSGLRMWSREQHSMATSTDPFTKNMVANEVSVCLLVCDRLNDVSVVIDSWRPV